MKDHHILQLFLLVRTLPVQRTCETKLRRVLKLVSAVRLVVCCLLRGRWWLHLTSSKMLSVRIFCMGSRRLEIESACRFSLCSRYLASRWFFWCKHEPTRAVVLKREPLGSLREEFLIPARKFAPRRNWGGRAAEENLKFLFLLVYSTQKKLHSAVGLNWNVYSTLAQAAPPSSFEPAVRSAHCLAALDLRAGIQQPIDCLVIQNCQAVQSMGRLL